MSFMEPIGSNGFWLCKLKTSYHNRWNPRNCIKRFIIYVGACKMSNLIGQHQKLTVKPCHLVKKTTDHKLSQRDIFRQLFFYCWIWSFVHLPFAIIGNFSNEAGNVKDNGSGKLDLQLTLYFFVQLIRVNNVFSALNFVSRKWLNVSPWS